ncbi:MAG: DUF4097 family beta strand repeat protein [Candidatus Aminicenantes bacterium]|nr:DUF4097 family beta strand repeat protein [Candidatus Aminicenantes bacterium]
MTVKSRALAIGIGLVFILAGAGLLAAAGHEEEFTKTLPLKAGDTFSLANVNGRVSISSWPEAKVEIKALKVAERDADDLKKVEIVVEERAGAVAVKAVWPKLSRDLRVRVEFDVKVPEGVLLNGAETVNGDVSVTGRYGAIDVETTNGGIDVRDAVGDLDAETTNGTIRVQGLDGRVDAETTNGSIRLEGIRWKDGLRAETTNGGISLRFEDPDKVNAQLRAETTNGHISFEFPVTLKTLKKSRRELDVEIGQGGPLIRLSTTNGSITIAR